MLKLVPNLRCLAILQPRERGTLHQLERGWINRSVRKHVSSGCSGEIQCHSWLGHSLELADVRLNESHLSLLFLATTWYRIICLSCVTTVTQQHRRGKLLISSRSKVGVIPIASSMDTPAEESISVLGTFNSRIYLKASVYFTDFQCENISMQRESALRFIKVEC